MGSRHDEDVARATEAWRRWCRSLEDAGVAALEATFTDDEIDLAEGLRHLARMARISTISAFENTDPAHPYLWRALGPQLKMGGDNPQGLYLSAPINGTDTFRLRGTRGSARWISMLAQRGPAAAAEGLSVFGDALFATDLVVDEDGSFEVLISPERPSTGAVVEGGGSEVGGAERGGAERGGSEGGESEGSAVNWIQSDRFSARILVRQFFGTWDDVVPMDVTIENLGAGPGDRAARAPEPLTLDVAVAQLARSAGQFSVMVPMMQGELAAKGEALNTFETDIGAPTSNSGGVPGGNAVTARWCLEPDEALVVTVTPPTPCAYWDVQVGNAWYESWDYRWYLSGLTCEQAHLADDGSVTFVIAERDPGVVNWLEAAGHRQGHVAVRWQLTDGQLPIPETKVVKVAEVASLTGLPAVTPTERLAHRRALAAAFDSRFRP